MGFTYEGVVLYFSIIMWCPEGNILIYCSWRTGQGGLHVHIIWLLWIDICKATCTCLLFPPSPPPKKKVEWLEQRTGNGFYAVRNTSRLWSCLTVSNKTCPCFCLISWNTFSVPLIIAEESWELIKSFYGATLSRKIFLWQDTVRLYEFLV